MHVRTDKQSQIAAQTEKKEGELDHATAWTKHAPVGSLADIINRAPNPKPPKAEGGVVLERFSSANLEQPPKQGSNHSFNSGGPKRAKTK